MDKNSTAELKAEILRLRQRVAELEQPRAPSEPPGRLTADLLQAVLDNLPHVVDVKDLEGRYVYVNQAWVELTPGVSDQAQALGRTEGHFCTAEKAAQIRAQEQQVLSSGQPWLDHDWGFLDRQGRLQWRRMSRLPLRDAAGRIVALLAAQSDITAEKQAQAELAHQEKLLRAVLEGSQEGITLTRMDGRVRRELVLCNRQFVEMSGRTEAELMAPEGFNRFIRPLEEPADLHERQVRRLPRRGVCSWMRPDGRENYIEWTTTPIELDGQEYLLGVDRDVTAARKAQAELARNEKLLRTLLERSQDGISLAHIDKRTGRQRLVMYNETFVEMSGRTEREVAAPDGYDSYIRIVEEQPDGLEQRRKGLPRRGVCSWLRRDGRENYIEWSGVNVELDGEQYVLAIDRDITAARKAQAELARSEKLLRTVLERSLDGINLAHINKQTGRHKLVMHNRRFIEMSGRSEEEVMAPEGYDHFLRILEEGPDMMERRRKGLPRRGVCSWLRRDGRENYIEWSAVNVELDGEEYVLAIDRDITAGRVAEQARRDSERRIREVLEASKDVIYRLNVDTQTYDYVSPSCRQVLGYDFEQFNAMGVSGFLTRVHPEDQATFRPLIDAVRARADDPATLLAPRQYRFKTHSGRYCWLSSSRTILRDPAGRMVALIGTMRDITDQKQAERALIESEAKYRTLVENAGEAIFTVGRDGKVLFLNTAAARQIGAGPRELVGRIFWELFPDSLSQRYRKFHAQALRTGQRLSVVTQAVLQGQWRWFQATLQPLVNPAASRPNRIMVVAQDITELREAELAARQAQQRLLTARDQERRRLAADLHDSLGQTLIVLRMTLQGVLAAAEEALTTEQTRALAGAARTCATLVKEVRSLCHGLFPPTLESLGLPAALRGLARDFEYSARVRIDCPEAMDQQRLAPETEISLFRAAQEALQNAVRHGQARRVLLRLRRRGDRVRLLIRDDGGGFDTAGARRGMGLQSMEERAKILGGRLEVRSAPGRTDVMVDVPEGNGPADGNGEPRAGRPAAGKRRNIKSTKDTGKSRGKKKPPQRKS